MCSRCDSRPLLIGEHGLDAPSGAKDVERLGETVVVNQAGVDGEKAHHEDDVAPAEERGPDLGATEKATDCQPNADALILEFCITGDSPAPRCWTVSFCAFSPSAPSTRRRSSSAGRGRGRRTSRRRERGR